MSSFENDHKKIAARKSVASFKNIYALILSKALIPAASRNDIKVAFDVERLCYKRLINFTTFTSSWRLKFALEKEFVKIRFDL